MSAEGALGAGGTDVEPEGFGGDEDLDLDLGGEDEEGGFEELELEPEPTPGTENLLATPGKRDPLNYKIKKNGKTTTGLSKGKWYRPVPKELDKRKSSVPRRKSIKKQFSDRLASSSRENTMPGLNSISRLSKGIYEDLDSNYLTEEQKILNSNDEVNEIMSQLEKGKDENK